MTRDELIARLDEAVDPGRALDLHIWCVANGVAGIGAMSARVRWLSNDFPYYTASLDAALTLLPDGWEWLRKSELSVTVYRVPDDDKTWARHIDGAHKTPAIALCIATLKARA